MADIRKITDFGASQLDIYARIPEVQLLRFHEPGPGIFIAESPNVVKRALTAGYEPISLLVETKHIKGEAKEVIAMCGDVPVYTAEFDILTKLTGFKLTRGAQKASVNPRSLCRGQTDRCAGKCCKSNKYRRCIPFSSRFEYGCGASDAGLQRSPVPARQPCQYGNRISGAVDLF